MQITCVKEIIRRVGVKMRIKNVNPNKAKLQLYKTAILPHLAYFHLV